MAKTYIAIDIGASSGRLIQSELEKDGRISMQEVHRFKNGFHRYGENQYWDIEYLIQEILTGLEKIKKLGISDCYVGIDTWAVDYCLVDRNDQLLRQPIAYRDKRTQHAIRDFEQIIPLKKIYEKTGIQIQPFNTLFQLFVEDQELLHQTKQILLIPDYLGFVFTGKSVLEKTNASTMQLLNVKTQKLDESLLDAIGVKASQFPNLVEAGTILGDLLPDKFIAFDLPKATFITVASHDTASAVVGTPGKGDDWAYISSGTWSLLGAEIREPICTEKAMGENYTNELGAYQTTRFLKNIMGMWLIQEVARQLNDSLSYPTLAEMAGNEPAFQQFINVNDPSFLNPDNMIEAIQNYCLKTAQKVPITPGQLARSIYDNLALCFGMELMKLEELLGKKINKLHIVGGGSNIALLNQYTADVTGITVEAGPAEATAIGNLLIQMIATGTFSSIQEARATVRHSFIMKTYTPKHTDAIIRKAQAAFIAVQTGKGSTKET